MFEIGVVVAVVMALGQFAKQYIPAKFIPLLTLVLGIAAGIFYLPADTLKEEVFNGVTVALAANGLFDLTKVMRK